MIESEREPLGSLEDAVDNLINGESDMALEYLRAHRDQVAEFCMKTVEAYRGGDNSGIILLSSLIEKLL